MSFDDGAAHPVIGQPVRLRDELRRGDTRGREIESSLAYAFNDTLVAWVKQHRLPTHAVIRALMGQLVAIIFARTTGLAEAREVGEEVCHELMRRLTEH